MRTLMLVLLAVGCAQDTQTTSTPGTTPVATTPSGGHDDGKDDDEHGEVGPEGPKHLAVPEITALSTDPVVIARGETVFAEKGCGACHVFGSKLVGPDLTGVDERREIAWIEKMIRHPDAMTKEDPVAKALLRSHMVQMPNQGVADEDLVALISYIGSK